MIDLTAAIDLVSAGSKRVTYDIASANTVGVAETAVAPAVLRVTTVTDAVKKVSDDRVLGSVDRDDLWAVAGFDLDAAVVGRFRSGSMELSELIDRVQEAGYLWKVATPSGL